MFLAKLIKFTNSKFFFSISLLKNYEFFPGGRKKKKTAKQFTVFRKESAVLCTVI
jgi:hypothetical protein